MRSERKRSDLLTITFWFCLSTFVHSAESPTEYFDKNVAPILVTHCLGCHSGASPEGQLDLSSRIHAFKKSGGVPIINAGEPEKSLLWQQIRSGEMPPESLLSNKEKRIMEEWIKKGAVWGADPIDPFQLSSQYRAGYDWWSLQPLTHIDETTSENFSIQNPIDRFIQDKLHRNKLKPSRRADPRTLVRRLFIDVTGLPPDKADVMEFIKNDSSQEWERLVDKVLASPHYGERWARHWMDIVRFGESDGYEYNRPRNNSWYYRDWLIRAFNEDMPYDTFVQMQIAGDVLSSDSLEGAAAVGFLVAGPHNTILGVDPVMKLAGQHDELEELAGVVGQTFLGMTIQCARCHDHKFDPISQKEYYQFIASLDSFRHGRRTINSEAEQKQVYTAVPGPKNIMRLFERGDVSLPTEEIINPGGLKSLVGVPSNFSLNSNSDDKQKRMALAHWVSHKDNALFHRVIINRVWYYHFGKGFISTPSDFGFHGGMPSHPELLDWLASWFKDNQYSLKKLHKLILMSSTYQQSSTMDHVSAELDQTNRYFWRQNPRRIEGEVLRDSILQISGVLNPQLFGPAYKDVRVQEVGPAFYYLPFSAHDKTMNRRTIYRWHVRGQRSALLDTFDCPDPSTQTPKRVVTTTPAQALSQWNDDFIIQMSHSLAKRIQNEVGPTIDNQVKHAWNLVLVRPPQSEELRRATEFVHKNGLAQFCRVLFNTNEFIVID